MTIEPYLDIANMSTLGKRKFCHHCKEYVSSSTYRRHRDESQITSSRILTLRLVNGSYTEAYTCSVAYDNIALKINCMYLGYNRTPVKSIFVMI